METTISILELLEQCRITRSSDIHPHEFLFTWQNTPCFPRGELVAVTGKAKSGKTYLNSILMAAGLIESGQGPLGLNRIRQEPLKIVWIDTEQSEDSTYEIVYDRLTTMIGNPPEEDVLQVYNLRKHTWQQREGMVQRAILINQPDLVIFDGIRDIVGDINDYQIAQEVVGNLLQVASTIRTCIVCVLHQNKAAEDKTLRGAIGTELQNKSFETYECVKDTKNRIFTVTQVATRKYDMPGELLFEIADGLPVECARVADNDKKDKYNPQFLSQDGKIDKEKLFGYILQGGKCMHLAQLRQVVMNVANVYSFNFAFRLIEEARLQGLIQSVEINGKSGYQLSP